MSDLRRLILPPAPTGLFAIQTGPSSALVTWNRVSTATSYQLYRDSVLIQSGPATSFTDSGLSTGSYFYTVSATNGNGTGPQSNSILIDIGDVIAPSVPGSLAASGVSTSQITVTWGTSTDTGGSGLAGYRLERSNDGTNNWAQVYQGTQTTFADTGLPQLTTRFYRVRAYDGANNNSAYSSVASAATQGTVVTSGDITTLLGAGTGSGLVTFGHLFGQGEVTGSVAVTDTANNAVPYQVDAKATHPDGSLRHAVITAQIAAGTTYKLRTAAALGGTPLTKAALISALGTCNVTLTGGQAGTFDIAGAVNASTDAWLSGPRVIEYRVTGSIGSFIYVVADCRLYSDGNVRIDVSIENPWVYGGLRGDRSYTYAITLAGTQRINEAVTHRANARIRKTFWLTTPTVLPQHNVTYLKATKGVPNYNFPDAISRVNATVYAGLPQAVSTLTSGSYGTAMETGGLDNGIGPCPHHQAVFLMNNGDTRAYTSVRDQVVGGGAYSIHARDQSTGRPVSIVSRPSAGWGSGNDFDSGGSGPSNASFSADTAHMPSIGYVPYAVTGDRWALDELHFWANWCLLTYETSISSRGGAQGLIKGQIRGIAWSLREIGRAAYITPDSDSLRSYFTTILDANRVYHTTLHSSGAGTNLLGAYDQDQLQGPGGTSTEQQRYNTKTWMDDFLTWTVGELYAMGFTNWASFYDFKAKFPIGRIGGTEFPFMALGMDQVRLCSTPGGSFFTTWTQVAAASPLPCTPLAAPNAGNPTVAQAAQLNASPEDGATHSLGIPRGYPTLPGSRYGIAFIAAAAVADRGTAGWERMFGRLYAGTKVANAASGPPRPNWVDSSNGGAANAVWPRRLTNSGVPAYITSIAPGACYQIPNTAYTTFARPASAVPGDSYGPLGIAHEYSGAIWDSIQNEYLIFGGGHPSGRNDLLAFKPYASENPTWYEKIAPSNVPASGGDTPITYQTYDGGTKPAATHTYSMLVHDKTNNRLFVPGMGSCYASGSEAANAWSVDLAPSSGWAWASRAPTPLFSGVLNNQGSSAVYDEHDGVVWHQRITGAALHKYTCATNTWTRVGGNTGMQIDFAMAINPWHRYLIAIGGYANNGPAGGGGNQIIITDLNTITAFSRSCTGLPASSKWGVEYHPPSNTFFAWNSGQTIYQLIPPADPFSSNWTANAITMTGATAPALGGNQGTYNKFRWCPYPNDPMRGVFLFFMANGSGVTNMFMWRPPLSAQAL